MRFTKVTKIHIKTQNSQKNHGIHKNYKIHKKSQQLQNSQKNHNSYKIHKKSQIEKLHNSQKKSQKS